MIVSLDLPLRCLSVAYGGSDGHRDSSAFAMTFFNALLRKRADTLGRGRPRHIPCAPRVRESGTRRISL